MFMVDLAKLSVRLNRQLYRFIRMYSGIKDQLNYEQNDNKEGKTHHGRTHGDRNCHVDCNENPARWPTPLHQDVSK
jgi:hypothetical protein